jgi:hypothetical protein
MELGVAKVKMVARETYETVQAPPATVFLQDLHSQIPTAVRLTEFFPQKVQV